MSQQPWNRGKIETDTQFIGGNRVGGNKPQYMPLSDSAAVAAGFNQPQRYNTTNNETVTLKFTSGCTDDKIIRALPASNLGTEFNDINQFITSFNKPTDHEIIITITGVKNKNITEEVVSTLDNCKVNYKIECKNTDNKNITQEYANNIKKELEEERKRIQKSNEASHFDEMTKSNKQKLTNALMKSVVDENNFNTIEVNNNEIKDFIEKLNKKLTEIKNPTYRFTIKYDVKVCCKPITDMLTLTTKNCNDDIEKLRNWANSKGYNITFNKAFGKKRRKSNKRSYKKRSNRRKSKKRSNKKRKSKK